MAPEKIPLLPYIYGIVSHKPARKCECGIICAEVEAALKKDNVSVPGNIDKEVQAAIRQGIKIGLLTKVRNVLFGPLQFTRNRGKIHMKVVRFYEKGRKRGRPRKKSPPVSQGEAVDGAEQKGELSASEEEGQIAGGGFLI